MEYYVGTLQLNNLSTIDQEDEYQEIYQTEEHAKTILAMLQMPIWTS